MPNVLHNLIMELSKEEEYKLPNILTFGKYKGKTIEYVMKRNIGYLRWVMGQDFLETPRFHNLRENIIIHLNY